MPHSADDSPPDYYGLLGVEPTASREEIRDAYRKKAQETHPDWNPDDPNASERFQKVKRAYQVLRDPERRAQYDDVRAARQRVPEGLTINQQAPAGCGGYIWRVMAGLLAVGLFLLLEAMDVWASDFWTIVLAVGAASLVAGGSALLLARQFPDEATDVMVRLTGTHILMRADGRTTFRIPWIDVTAVHVLDNGWSLELVVDPAGAEHLRPVPPVLIDVRTVRGGSRLRLDLSDTDVPRNILLMFLRETESIPFPEPARESGASRRA